VLDQVDDAAGIAPLVVIPADDLHKGWVQHDASLGVESAGDRASLEVCGNEGLFSVAEVSLHIAFRATLHLLADLLICRLLLQLNRQIND